MTGARPECAELGDRAGRRRGQGHALHVGRRPPGRRRVRVLRADRLGHRRPIDRRVAVTRVRHPTRAARPRPEGKAGSRRHDRGGRDRAQRRPHERRLGGRAERDRGECDGPRLHHRVPRRRGPARDVEPEPVEAAREPTEHGDRPGFTDRTIKLYSSSGAHLLADVSGYFTDDTAEDTDDGLFIPLVTGPAARLRVRPARSRRAATTGFAVTGRLGIPSTANAVVLNLTAVKTTGFGYVTGWPSDESQPGSSNLNVPRGRHQHRQSRRAAVADAVGPHQPVHARRRPPARRHVRLLPVAGTAPDDRRLRLPSCTR